MESCENITNLLPTPVLVLPGMFTGHTDTHHGLLYGGYQVLNNINRKIPTGN